MRFLVRSVQTRAERGVAADWLAFSLILIHLVQDNTQWDVVSPVSGEPSSLSYLFLELFPQIHPKM